jgi:hypothetical protein
MLFTLTASLYSYMATQLFCSRTFDKVKNSGNRLPPKYPDYNANVNNPAGSLGREIMRKVECV